MAGNQETVRQPAVVRRRVRVCGALAAVAAGLLPARAAIPVYVAGWALMPGGQVTVTRRGVPRLGG